MKAQTRPNDRPLNATLRTGPHGNYLRQCVRCGRHWRIKPNRPDMRNGMCVDCYSVDPDFGAAS